MGACFELYQRHARNSSFDRSVNNINLLLLLLLYKNNSPVFNRVIGVACCVATERRNITSERDYDGILTGSNI